MSGITQIAKKELDRVFRDRKMIFSVFILPVVIMIGIMSFVSNMAQKASDRVQAHDSRIYIANAPASFEDFLKKFDANIKLHEVTDMSAAEAKIREGEADLIIEFPESFLQDVQSYEAGAAIPQIKTFYNPSEDYSQAAFNTYSTGALELYRQQLLAGRVTDMAKLTVFTVNSDNPNMIIQNDQKAGGKVLGTMLPYFITILLFAGAMGIGTDMIAGEKERGTMASLLVSPVKRSSIVLGKVFSLMILSGLSSIIYVTAMVIFMPKMIGMSGSDMGVSLSLRPGQIAMLAGLLIAIAFLYATIIVLISVFAKTVKEASSYIMPAYMLILVLGISTMFTTGRPSTMLYLVPIYNTALALQGILTQEVTMPQFGMSLGVTLVLGLIMIGLIAKAFESEKVMSI